MNRVFADRQSKFLTDGACVCVCWVGCTHNFAILQDGVFAFENLNDCWARRHGFNQLTKERTFFMNSVEAFSFTGAHPNALRSNNTQTSFFELGGDSTSQVAAGRIRLDHGEGTFDCHYDTLYDGKLEK